MRRHIAMALLAAIFVSTGCLDDEPVTGTGRAKSHPAADHPTDLGQLDKASNFAIIIARHGDQHNRMENSVPMHDATGVFTTVSAHGFIDLDNEFFQDLGSNGRRCVSCHVPSVGWTITPDQLEETFEDTDGGVRDDGSGLGAVFRSNDGANSPRADVSTMARRRQAYSMLLDHGLVRVGLPIPANAEFELVAVDDPYRFASAAELSLFRRPLPTTNLKFDSTVMWDGREVVPGASVTSELEAQASDATIAHARGHLLTAAQRASIARFELELASAQVYDDDARELYNDGARGGPGEILAQPFYVGINDNFGDSQTMAPFTSNVFTIFNRWERTEGYHAQARWAIARGQALFNTRSIAITGVSGINDEAVFGKPAVLNGTCSSCHNTPNGGNHSVVAPLDIGLVDASRRTPEMPLYTLRNKTTGEIVQVTDPGRAMIDGKWSHIGRFKGPMLRNLAPRAPYFHNGFAADLGAVVEFYNTRFQIGFTDQEKADLVAFLRSL
jgi:cytochrome c peroxidase